MKKFSISILFALVAILLINSPSSEASDYRSTVLSQAVDYSHSSGDREYISNNTPNPKKLIVALHGYNSSARLFAYKSSLHNLATDDTLVVYPKGKSSIFPLEVPSWNAQFCCGESTRDNVDDKGFILSLISDLQRTYSISPEMTSLIGFSNGAFLALDIASTNPDAIDSVVSISGTMGTDQISYSPTKPKDILLMHGINDKVVNFEGGTDKTLYNWMSHSESYYTWADINNCDSRGICSSRTETFLHDDAHNIPDQRLFNPFNRNPSGSEYIIDFIETSFQYNY